MNPAIAAQVRTAVVAAVIAASWAGLAASSIAAAAAAAGADPDAWTVYHGGPAGQGVSPVAVSVDAGSPAWTSAALDGELYGEPLVADGRVYVATEDDRVYALSTGTGAVLWSTRLGTAVPASSLPCGNIQPTVGITGTPVVDEARGELFVVADELVSGAPAHLLVGLAISNGQVETSVRVDPPGSLPSALLQRTGLTLDAGQVVFGFGGNYGDCSDYRGWVVAANESGGAPRYFAVDGAPGERQGAIWMGGGAPAVDGQGDIWVSAGNGSAVSPGDRYDDSDSVLELSPALQQKQFFAPSDWAADNAADRDLSMEPVLLGDGGVMVAGKSRTAYLLDGAHLGGIGGQLAALPSVCNDDVAGGGAATGTVVYLPCTTGVVAVDAAVSPPGVRMLWSSEAGGGPPIVAGGLVWTIARSGTLYGLDPATGAVRRQAPVVPPANDFPTPSVGDGLLLVATGDRVEAFAAPAAGAPTATTTSPSTTVPLGGAPGPIHGEEPAVAGGLPPGALAALAVGGAAVLGAAWWILRRRARRTRTGSA